MRRSSGDTRNDPVGLLWTWVLNLDGGIFGGGEDRGPVQGALGAALTERPARSGNVGIWARTQLQ